MTWVFYNFYSGIWIRIGEILKYYGGVIGLEELELKYLLWLI